MNKDSDGQCEVSPDWLTIKLVAKWSEREAVVRFLRKFNGMEAVAARIEKGDHLDAIWTE